MVGQELELLVDILTTEPTLAMGELSNDDICRQGRGRDSYDMADHSANDQSGSTHLQDGIGSSGRDAARVCVNAIGRGFIGSINRDGKALAERAGNDNLYLV
jgi:hypothetical protein